MKRTLFISDLHFNHKNIIQHDDRPFSDVEDMKKQIIDNWNQAVHLNDCVYILGDFYWGNKAAEVLALLNQLNGEKRLIKGNHDPYTNKIEVIQAFDYPIKDIDYIQVEGRNVVLSHYPLASWRNMLGKDFKNQTVLLYGHVHMSDEFDLFEAYLDQLRAKKNTPIYAYNVGASCPWIDYRPQTLAEIEKRYWSMKQKN